MRRTHGRGLSLTGALLGAMLLAPAAAGAACTFNATTGLVTETIPAGGTSTVGRSVGGAITVNGVACSTATVSNTDTIRITAPNTDSDQLAILSLANGPLGPGKTAETTGTSEIEVQVQLGPGFSDQFVLSGSDLANNFTLGSLGANLNGDADGNDVTWSGIDFEFNPLEVRGLAGNDVISAAGGLGTGTPRGKPVYLAGGAGADTLTGGSYTFGDEIWGDADEAFGDPSAVGNDVLRGGGGDDLVHGNDGNDTIDGQTGHDTLYLDAGTDTLTGGDGSDSFDDDLFDGEPDGADSISGGRGFDTIDLSNRIHNLVISVDNVANDGADNALPAGTADEGDNIRADVETFFLGQGNDSLNADTTAANAAAVDNELYGGFGNDTLSGGDGDDIVEGEDDNDTLKGGFGEDSVYGWDGNDTVSGGDGDDDVHPGDGTDTATGDAGDDYFSVDFTADGADSLSGGAGLDQVDYSSRSSSLRISLDNVANDGADLVAPIGTAEEGDNVRSDMETIWSGDGADTLNANTTAANTAGAENELHGGPGADVMSGGTGEDWLDGEGANDTLNGGGNQDTLDGGGGADIFQALDTVSDVIDCGAGDAIADNTTNRDAFDWLSNCP